jgi:hypothetical protein
MVFFWLLSICVLGQETQRIDLKDGETAMNEITSDYGGNQLYKFHVGSASDTKELVISLTTYSDFSDPDMYVRVGTDPTVDIFDFSSLSWGSGSIIVPPLELEENKDYHIVVFCYTVCKYGITASYAQMIKLTDGVPIAGDLTKGRQALYEFTPGSAGGNTVTVTLSQVTGTAFMYVVKDTEKEPTSDNSEAVEKTWDGNLEFKTHDFNKNSIFKIAIMCEKDTEYNILAKSSKAQATQLQTGVPINGEVPTNDINFYFFSVLSGNETVSISLTMVSGDADLYVRYGQVPTEKEHDFESIHMGNENLIVSPEDRKKLGKPTGKYYIGVFGYVHSVYTLTVLTTNSSIVKLLPNIPQSGSVYLNNMSYFSLDFPQSNTNITIFLTASSGNPDLYAKICKRSRRECHFRKDEILNPSEIFSSSHDTASESIEIAHDVSLCTKKFNCSYIIGVYGRSDYSTYTIMISTNNSDEIILFDGKPSTFVVQEGREMYFKYTVFNETVTNVSFMLTPIYGDPDLFGSLNLPIIDMQAEKSSNQFGVEVDQIRWVKGIDSNSLKGTYHIMVFSSDACSFSIVAISVLPGKNTTIQIFPGHPQKDTVYNYTDQDYRIYSFPVHYSEENKETITISLTPITGKFNLYAANSEKNLDWSKEIFYYNWKADNSNHSDPSSTIIIKPDDPWFRTDSTYLILVMAEKFLPDHSATYVVSYSAGNGSVFLAQDVPYTGVVSEEQYSYFIFPVHFSHEDVTISVTALSGDPDIFISVDPKNPNPTAEKCDFRSTNFGDEKITITWESGLKEKCPNLPKNYTFGQKTECYLYVSVYGFQVTTFVIRVHPSKGNPLLLNVGNSAYGNLTKSEYAYFYSIVATSNDLRVTLQSFSGDADLFLNVIDKASENNDDEEKWARPTREKSEYASQSTVMSEEIELKTKELNNKCASKTCILLISAYCFSDNCGFMMTVNQKNEVQVLIENQATYGETIFNQFVYYSYYLSQDFENFLVTVTSLDSGNPDLFISKGKNNFPNETSFDWFSNGWGGDSILITKDDTFFNGGSMKGTYNIGVKDPFSSGSFSIIVNNNPKAVQKLVQGVPQHGELNMSSIGYFSFMNYMNDDVVITLTPITGSAKLYVTVRESWVNDIYSKLPGPGDYLWSSDTSNDRYKIDIPVNGNNFCTYCDYVIAVQASSTQNVVFTITAKNKMQYSVLQDGVPTRVDVEKGKLSLLKFEVSRRTDITISVTAYNSHPNIYVSKEKEMVYENYIKQAYYTDGVYNIRINRDDEVFYIGTYYIGLESSEPSSVAVVANTAEKPVQIIDGWPLFSSFSTDVSIVETINYKFIANSGSRVFCYLKTFSSSKPTIFTLFSNTGDRVRVDESTSSKTFTEKDYLEVYSSEFEFSSEAQIILDREASKPQLNLAVKSNSGGTFQIRCSDSTQIMIVRLGALHIEFLDNTVKTKQYELVVPKAGVLDVYVIPCTGEYQLNISSNWTIFSQNNPDVVVSRMVDGLLIGSINNAQGSYYASVTNLKKSSEMQIFQFYTVFTEKKNTVPKVYKPGNNGLLTWEVKEEKNVEISWKAVEDDTGKEIEKGTVYNVYFSEQSTNNLITACGTHYYSARKKVKLLKTTSDLSAEVKLPKEKGFINVIAHVPRNSSSPIKEIIYDPMEVLIIGRPTGRGLLIFWLLATLLFVAVVFAIYLYRKKVAADTRLRYEMSDVRNMASVPQSEMQSIKRKDPYERLST